MDAHPARANVRRRLAAGLPGFAIFLVLGLAGTDDTWQQPWLFVGFGLMLSVTFVEPFFSTPRAAVLNAAGGIAAAIGADHGHLEGLWYGLLGLMVLVFLAAVVASTTADSKLNSACRQFASRFGSAVVIGGTVLFLIALTDAQLGRDGFQALTVGSVVLLAAVSFDWLGLWRSFIGGNEAATAIAAIGPRMLLVSAPFTPLDQGDSLTIESAQGQPIDGTVVARLPHANGLRYQVALGEEWTSICQSFPHAVTVHKSQGERDLVGAVSAGTTQRLLEFEPFGRLSVGDPLLLNPDGQNLLYQVARLRLQDSNWLGANFLSSHATAHLIGSPESNRIRSVSYLPNPHEPVHRAAGVTGQLDAEYYEIGCIKGTSIPIGLRTDDERRGHIAILGMSGMGKTAVAQRICSTLGGNDVVIAMDTTGEYRTRLGFPNWTTGDFDSAGHFVFEPAGDPPARARQFIEDCMTAGSTEYAAGTTPTPRVVVLEEAHTFLPEWNVALRPQQEQVAHSTRMIMQARKFGITFMVVSQRTAVVSKSALSQCENYIILKTLDHTGLEYLESLVGPAMRDAIPALERFEAMCVGPAFNAEEPVIVTLAAP
jgi:hypothetical protein